MLSIRAKASLVWFGILTFSVLSFYHYGFAAVAFAIGFYTLCETWRVIDKTAANDILIAKEREVKKKNLLVWFPNLAFLMAVLIFKAPIFALFPLLFSAYTLYHKYFPSHFDKKRIARGY